MTALLYVSAIGATVGIELSALDHDDAEAVRTVWADAAVEAVDAPVAIVIPRPSDRARMLQSLSRQVTHAAIDARQAELWMLHAAGIATPQGDVVVLVGPSGRGKTTASRHLGQHYGYVSDETIGIAPDGRVLAYRKPLSIIEEPRKPKVERGPSSVGLGAIPPDLRVRAIVLLHRDAEHVGTPVVSPVDLRDALEDLVTQSSHLVARSDSLRFIAAIAGATGGINAVRYRDASELSTVVPELLERPLSSPVVAPQIARQVASAKSDTDEPRFFRATIVDELALGASDRLAVLTRDVGGRGTLHVLDGIAPTLWAAASGVPFGALVAAVTNAHGAPEGGNAADLVRASVGRLVAEGLLRVVSTAAS
jgi:energy-coupling factor transporter ATP-binding protein EcfA2